MYSLKICIKLLLFDAWKPLIIFDLYVWMCVFTILPKIELKIKHCQRLFKIILFTCVVKLFLISDYPCLNLQSSDCASGLRLFSGRSQIQQKSWSCTLSGGLYTWWSRAIRATWASYTLTQPAWVVTWQTLWCGPWETASEERRLSASSRLTRR